MKITKEFAPITIKLETEREKLEFIEMLRTFINVYERSRWSIHPRDNEVSRYTRALLDLVQ